MSSSSGSEFWNEGLKLISFCPVCETRYNPMGAHVLGQEGDTQLVHVRCRKCQNSILALVLVNQSGASSVGLVTDLSYDDVLRFKNSRAISIDDVVEAHTFFHTTSWQLALGRMSQARVHSILRKRDRLKKTNA